MGGRAAFLSLFSRVSEWYCFDLRVDFDLALDKVPSGRGFCGCGASFCRTLPFCFGLCSFSLLLFFFFSFFSFIILIHIVRAFPPPFHCASSILTSFVPVTDPVSADISLPDLPILSFLSSLFPPFHPSPLIDTHIQIALTIYLFFPSSPFQCLAYDLINMLAFHRAPAFLSLVLMYLYLSLHASSVLVRYVIYYDCMSFTSRFIEYLKLRGSVTSCMVR